MQLLTDGLERAHGSLVCCDGVISLAQRAEQTPCLPLPAVQRFGCVDLLGCKDSPTRQLQGLSVAVLILIQSAQIAPSVRGSTAISEGLSHGARLTERLGSQA